MCMWVTGHSWWTPCIVLPLRLWTLFTTQPSEWHFVSCAQLCRCVRNTRATLALWPKWQEARRSDTDSVETRSLSGLGRHLPKYLQIVVCTSHQQAGRIGSSRSRGEEATEVWRFKCRRWLCAICHWNFRRVGRTSDGTRHGDWSSNCWSKPWFTFDIVPASANLRGSTERKCSLR